MKPQTLYAFQIWKMLERLPKAADCPDDVLQFELDTPEGPRFVRFVKDDFRDGQDWALQMRIYKSKMRKT